MNKGKSINAFDQAFKIIPGGVNSPVRAFSSVGGTPLFIDHAKGSRIVDIDGNNFIDYVCSWGPMILGHAYEPIVDIISSQASLGTSYGAPTQLESEMASLIVELVPSIDMVRMVNSGTEATMSAIRLARGYTSKNKIIKFAGCYHGHGDSFLIKAGSGAITLGLPDSPGVTHHIAQDTLVAEYNNLDSVEALFKVHSNDIAAIIVEPVAGNMGVVAPKEGFLKGLRELADKYHAILIFDEVITGFRLGTGGAQELFGVTPDITTLGKIIGGGLPVGAYGGKREIMEFLAPIGPVYQAGTLSGNPLAMAAGIVMLETLKENPNIYIMIDKHAELLAQGLRDNLKNSGIPGVVNQVGSLITLFFTNLNEVNSFDDAMQSNKERYSQYFNHCLESGIYLAPSQFEASFISAAHSEDEINRTIKLSAIAMQKLS